MGARIVFVVVLLAVCLEYIFAAPHPNPAPFLERQDLAQRFVEFLKDDQELSGVLGKVDWAEDHLVRNRRQATGSQGLDDPENIDIAQQPGFFDRAAKFVTELLQRFLKWINSSDN